MHVQPERHAHRAAGQQQQHRAPYACLMLPERPHAERAQPRPRNGERGTTERRCRRRVQAIGDLPIGPFEDVAELQPERRDARPQSGHGVLLALQDIEHGAERHGMPRIEDGALRGEQRQDRDRREAKGADRRPARDLARTRPCAAPSKRDGGRERDQHAQMQGDRERRHQHHHATPAGPRLIADVLPSGPLAGGQQCDRRQQGDRVHLGLGRVIPHTQHHAGADRRRDGAACADPARRHGSAQPAGQRAREDRQQGDRTGGPSLAKSQCGQMTHQHPQRGAGWMRHAQRLRRGDELRGVPEGQVGGRRPKIGGEQHHGRDPARDHGRGQSESSTRPTTGRRCRTCRCQYRCWRHAVRLTGQGSRWRVPPSPAGSGRPARHGPAAASDWLAAPRRVPRRPWPSLPRRQ